MKNWFKRVWSRIRAFFYSVLVALGIVAAPMVTIAGPVHFTYTPAVQRVDGTPMPLSEIAFSRLYCNGTMIVEEAGADGDFDPVLQAGTHTCGATHVDTAGQESDLSDTVVKIVLPALPGSPQDLRSD